MGAFQPVIQRGPSGIAVSVSTSPSICGTRNYRGMSRQSFSATLRFGQTAPTPMAFSQAQPRFNAASPPLE